MGNLQLPALRASGEIGGLQFPNIRAPLIATRLGCFSLWYCHDEHLLPFITFSLIFLSTFTLQQSAELFKAWIHFLRRTAAVFLVEVFAAFGAQPLAAVLTQHFGW